jgi:predicted dienelactone hydrolase
MRRGDAANTMKWIWRALALLALIALALIACELATALRPTRPVGFQALSVPDPGAPPLTVAVWYPTQGAPRPMLLGLIVQFVARNAPIAGARLPLIVISHGNGGGPGSHTDTALALAQAGFIVAAPMHTGDNYSDQSSVGGPQWLLDRSRHIPRLIDYLLARWTGRDRIDASRIGIFGFSAGAFTALTTIGGEPDVARIASHCAQTPELACQLWKPGSVPLPAPGAFAHDDRVRAAVIAAPGYGFTFVPDGLSKVAVPVQLWSGELDTNVPTASNAAVVYRALGSGAELHVVPGAGHFSFLVPCGLIGPPLLCRDRAGFDRAAFHRSFNAQVVAFFQGKLSRPRAESPGPPQVTSFRRRAREQSGDAGAREDMIFAGCM